jgi:hypothetical protein
MVDVTNHQGNGNQKNTLVRMALIKKKSLAIAGENAEEGWN